MPVFSLSWSVLTLVTLIVYPFTSRLSNYRGEYSGFKERTINMYMDMELTDPERSSYP